MTKLLSVQEAALAACQERDRFGYFLEMGLGKTLLALHEYSKLFLENKADIMLIVCPNTLISTWQAEIKKHGFAMYVQVKPQEWRPRSDEMHVLIYNYESLIATAGKLLPVVVNQARTYAVFDESVQIKNFRSERWKKIKVWQEKLKYVRLLSGRPMVHSPMDLWTQLTMLRGQVHTSPFAYRNTYCIMGGWQNKQVIGTKNLDRLRDITKEVSFTATKAKWTDLPEKLYTSREYIMTVEQQAAYKSMFKAMIVEFQEKNKIITVDQAVHKYAKLQQVGSGFMMDTPTGEVVPIMDFAKVPKVEALMEVVEELRGNSKLIIFAHYTASILALQKLLGWPVIQGGMKTEEIQKAVESFNNDDSIDGFIGQLSAAKYGLTLLGSAAKPCHTTFYFENTYSLDPRIQSEDRNHRHGQRNAVLYVDVFGTPVERKIIRVLQMRDDLSRTVLDMAKEDSGWSPEKKLQTNEQQS